MVSAAQVVLRSSWREVYLKSAISSFRARITGCKSLGTTV
ncbi:hypothetical protein HMPREF9244_00503 [Alloscardovia omnicolens F0580]|uniref:Uncharacterized protein n=1 Tax=Alloscardovia omnicolens F0580 TaxID=1321816 RepID=U1RBH5_9BIFI|nr:hypothetical protein HMPREF9244_00503 [Alloscardovia omnicolens F0580]